jgi:HD-GYP domain-containing protein (c-di-GMP phosphodiesterase class II)
LLTAKKLVLLTNKLQVRDEITYRHSIRAAAYAVICGRALSLSQDRIRHLYYGMLLHDIGKIKMPLDILYKKEPLTEAEKKEIRCHPEIGCSIVLGYNPSRDVYNIILFHHERWDGNGYPRGLSGKSIPLLTRIASVADAYEAMTSARPYRRGVSHEDAAAEIKRLAGKQFDPHIADVFCSAIEKELGKWDKNLRFAQKEGLVW